MNKVKLLVAITEDGFPRGGYVSDVLNLPFVPMVGMKFKQGTSTKLWETGNFELYPAVEAVTYDIDEETIYCVFRLKDVELTSTFWKPVEFMAVQHLLN